MTAYQADYAMAAVTLRIEGSPMYQADQRFSLPMADLANADGPPSCLPVLQSHAPVPVADAAWGPPSRHMLPAATGADSPQGLWPPPSMPTWQPECRAVPAGVQGKLWGTFLPLAQPEPGQAPPGISLLARDFQVVPGPLCPMVDHAQPGCLSQQGGSPPACHATQGVQVLAQGCSLLPACDEWLPPSCTTMKLLGNAEPWLQTVTLYQRSGEFAGVRRFGSGNPIVIDDVRIWVEGAVGASGLELKADPGVPVVYAGFGGAPGSCSPASSKGSEQG